MRTYYKSKILISGIFPMEKYQIDNYCEKTAKYDDSKINVENEDSIFYESGYLIKSLYSQTDRDGYYYEYFENDDFIELEVDEETYKDDRKLKIYYSNIIAEKVSFLEKKLRLITGLRMGLPAFNVNIYDENKKYKIRVGAFNSQNSCLNVSDYNEYTRNILEKRLRFYISDETLKNLEKNNSRFRRAFMFYNQSFQLDNINIRFILLFSALESLFNIESENITDDISKYGSKIQFLNKKQEKKIKWKLIDFYNIRSFYIHGNDPKEITEKNEFDLREIVRKTLIIYWYISLNQSITSPEEIKSYIDEHNQSNLPLQIQLFIKALDVINFTKYYNDVKQSLLNGNTNILSQLWYRGCNIWLI